MFLASDACDYITLKALTAAARVQGRGDPE